MPQFFLFFLRAVFQPFRASRRFHLTENKSRVPCFSPLTSNEIRMVTRHFISDRSASETLPSHSGVSFSPVLSGSPRAKNKERNKPFFSHLLSKCFLSNFPGLHSAHLPGQPCGEGITPHTCAVANFSSVTPPEAPSSPLNLQGP